jgi:hypothetical protein
VLLPLGAIGAPHRAAGPKARLTVVDGRVNVGQSLFIRYSTSHLPTRTSLYLQRQEGATHAWRDVEALRGVAGTATAAGLGMGAYEYRIKVLKRRVGAKRRILTTSAPKAVFSYGNVPMLTICQTATVGGYGCSTQTDEVGAVTFTYVVQPYTDQYPGFSAALSYGSTTCRTATIAFASTNDNPSSGLSYAELQQVGPAAEVASTPALTIGAFAARFNGRPWSLGTSSDDGDGVAVNGVFSCYTPTGF